MLVIPTISRKTTLIAALATLTLLGVGVAAAASTSPNATYAFDPQTGTISNYGVGNQTIFASISFASWNASAAKERHVGRLGLALDGADAQIATFDAKNAALFVRSPAGNTVTFVVADGIGLTSYAGEKGWAPPGVLLAKGNQTARLELHGGGNVTVSGQTIIVTLDPHAHLSFRIVGHPGEVAKERRALEKIARHAKRQ